MKEVEEVAVNVPVEDAPTEPVGNALVLMNTESCIEEDKFYREMRKNEQLDDLAIRVMSLPNDTYTDEIKQLAAKHLAKRFS